MEAMFVARIRIMEAGSASTAHHSVYGEMGTVAAVVLASSTPRRQSPRRLSFGRSSRLPAGSALR